MVPEILSSRSGARLRRTCLTGVLAVSLLLSPHIFATAEEAPSPPAGVQPAAEKPAEAARGKKVKVITHIGKKRTSSGKKGKAKDASPAAAGGDRLSVKQVLELMLGTKNLSGMDLSGLDLAGRNLRSADLSGANLAGANLERTDLQEANLERAVLTNADLRSSNMKLANLTGARLDGAQLDEAFWTDGHICRKGSVGRCLDLFDTP